MADNVVVVTVVVMAVGVCVGGYGRGSQGRQS